GRNSPLAPAIVRRGRCCSRRKAGFRQKALSHSVGSRLLNASIFSCQRSLQQAVGPWGRRLELLSLRQTLRLRRLYFQNFMRFVVWEDSAVGLLSSCCRFAV